MKNVDPELFPPRAALIQDGLLNFIASLGKETAQSGEVMFMIDGLEQCPTVEGARKRFVGQLSDVTYSPFVFDVHRNVFKDPSQGAVQHLELPVLLRLGVRYCRIATSKQCLDHMTSDELILELCSMSNELFLRHINYQVCSDIDDSISWSRIVGITTVGKLWSADMNQPLLHGARSRPSKPRFARVDTSDPLVTSRAHKTPSSRARHRPSRSRRVISARVTCGDEAGGLPIEDASPEDGDDLDNLGDEDRVDLVDHDHESMCSEDLGELEAALFPDAPDPGVAHEWPAVHSPDEHGIGASELPEDDISAMQHASSVVGLYEEASGGGVASASTPFLVPSAVAAPDPCAVGLKSYEFTTTRMRAPCGKCKARIEPGSWRFVYRYQKGKKISDESRIHLRCLPDTNRDEDIRRLERFVLEERGKSSADPGVLDMLETALSSLRLPNGASASSS